MCEEEEEHEIFSCDMIRLAPRPAVLLRSDVVRNPFSAHH